MELTVVDHLLVVILVLVEPPFGVWGFGLLKRAIASGNPHARVRAYRVVIVFEWLMVASVLALWWRTGRALGDLGFRLETTHGFWIGFALTVLAVGLMVRQARGVHVTEADRAKFREAAAAFADMLPVDDRDARWFNALSVTAGICEEILYRGFLIAYLGAVMPLGGWLGALTAVVISSLIFGLGHLYQGGTGVAKTAAVGLFLAGLYLLTGSLWAPIALHAVIDITSGKVLRNALSDSGSIEDPI